MIRRTFAEFTLAAAIILPTVGPAAWAHHGWSSYDTARALTVTVPVLDLRYTNPHGEIVL